MNQPMTWPCGSPLSTAAAIFMCLLRWAGLSTSRFAAPVAAVVNPATRRENGEMQRHRGIRVRRLGCEGTRWCDGDMYQVTPEITQ